MAFLAAVRQESRVEGHPESHLDAAEVLVGVHLGREVHRKEKRVQTEIAVAQTAVVAQACSEATAEVLDLHHQRATSTLTGACFRDDPSTSREALEEVLVEDLA